MHIIHLPGRIAALILGIAMAPHSPAQTNEPERQIAQSMAVSTTPDFNPEWSPLLILTEHSPPGEYLDENGELAGATVNLIRHLMQQMGEKGNMQLLPWARALAIAKSHPGIALFETIRNDEREALFKWVGPLKHYQISLYARTDRVEPGLTMPQLAQRYNVCANRGSVYANMLQAQGFIPDKNLILTVNEDRCARMLVQQKVDLAPFNENTVQHLAADITVDPEQLFPAILLTNIKLYIAFSKDVDDQRITRWQNALETSYRDGTMRKLYTGVYSESAIKRLEQFAAAPNFQTAQ